MSMRFINPGRACVLGLAGLLLALAAGPALPSVRSPIDGPATTEPRVAVGKSLSGPGFWGSRGVHEPFEMVRPRETVFSRDVLVALPGFQADVVPTSKGVRLTLFGNLPEMSDSNCLESAVVLHDTSAFDLDFTLLRGRVVLTNTKGKGEAKVWLRTEWASVQLSLHEPGDAVALEIYGRWAPGVAFTLKKNDRHVPVQLWDVNVLKGKVDVKTGKNEFHMEQAPGRGYFHGDNVSGPNPGGPETLKETPAWADPKAKVNEVVARARSVAAEYRKLIEESEQGEAVPALLAAAAKEKDKDRAVLMRRILVFGLAALDDVEMVVKMLNESKHDEVRKAAVIALRHWIGARAGRDELLYAAMVEHLHFTRAESASLMQLLHSPFDARQSVTYEALIAYLRHRKQAVRELAHWHLVRLAPIGRRIDYDASADSTERDKAVVAWEKLVPAGTLPKAEQEK